MRCQDLNFEEIAINTDEELQQLQRKWWPILYANVDMQNPQGVFRIGLLKLAYSYSRLIALSYGFQHAFGKNTSNNQNEKTFLMRCLSAARDVITAVVHDNNRENSCAYLGTVSRNLFRILTIIQSSGVYVRHGPDAQSVFITFAAAFLVKILQPKFAPHIDNATRTDILQCVQSTINYLGSPQVGMDERYGPKMYAKFLKNLLASPLVTPGGDIPRRKSSKNKSPTSATSPSFNTSNHHYPAAGAGDGSAIDHPSPSTTHSMSPPASHDAMSFDQFAPSNGSADPFAPPPSFDMGSGSSSQYDGMSMNPSLNDYFEATATTGAPLIDEEMIQSISMNMQSLSDPNQQWQDPGIFFFF